MNTVNFKEKFWSFVSELTQKNEINNYYLVEERNNISYNNPDDDILCQKYFDGLRKVLYINVSTAYEEFKTHLSKQQLPVCSAVWLKNFLKGEINYLGYIKCKKINAQSVRCYIFDITDTRIVLPEAKKETITKADLDFLSTDADIQKKKAETNKYLDEVEILKASELRHILESHYVDDERSIMGSEPFWVPIVTGKNRDIVMSKLIEIIKHF